MSKTSTFDKPLGSHYRSRLDFHETKEVYNERAIDAGGTGSTKDFGVRFSKIQRSVPTLRHKATAGQ